MWVEIAVAFVIWLIWNKSRNKGIPGPWWNLPLVGYMPFFAWRPLQKLKELAKYGEITQIYLGAYRIVVLNSAHAIKEAFKEDSFSGRPALKMLEVRNGGVHLGLVCSEGKDWQEQRKFTLRHLRELGFGKGKMEGMINEEVDELVKSLKSTLGSPIDLKSKFNLAVLNALWRIICGKKYSHDDTRLQTVLEKTSADLAETEYTGPVLFLPWLLKIAPRLTRWNEFIQSIKSVHEFLKEIIMQHKTKIQGGNEASSEDFIDAYLAEIGRTEDPNSSFYKEKGEHYLLVVLLDLFMAGGDTTSATLYWAFLYMILNPRVQINVQEEIDLVVGNGNSGVTLDHRKLMPYTEATISEVLRKSSLVPMGLFHSAVCDTKLLGHEIPKDTVILANLYCLNHDEKYWKNCNEFQPERFLQGTKCDGFMPFSTGKRICPGENLARDQLFLFFVGLLQKFTFSADPNSIRPTDEPNYGIILSAKSYSIVLQERIPKIR